MMSPLSSLVKKKGFSIAWRTFFAIDQNALSSHDDFKEMIFYGPHSKESFAGLTLLLLLTGQKSGYPPRRNLIHVEMVTGNQCY